MSSCSNRHMKTSMCRDISIFMVEENSEIDFEESVDLVNPNVGTVFQKFLLSKK